MTKDEYRKFLGKYPTLTYYYKERKQLLKGKTVVSELELNELRKVCKKEYFDIITENDAKYRDTALKSFQFMYSLIDISNESWRPNKLLNRVKKDTWKGGTIKFPTCD